MATRRVNPRLMAAFEREQQPPIEPNPDLMAAFDAAGLPPREEFNPNDSGETASTVRPKSRFDVVREYLEANRQPMPQPTTPEVDVRAAADSDARRNFGASMLAAGQAFTGNRRAVGQMQSSNAQEAQALAEREARKRELEQWAANRERQRMGEAGLLGQALSADEMAAQREASLGVQKERLKLDETKATVADENADADRELKAKKGAGPKAPKPGQTFKDASALRKEFNALPEVKSFREASTSFDKIQRAAATPSAAGDLSLIFAYMKVLDPGSTVREGEFAAAAAAAGADQRLLGAIEKVRSGQKLTPEQRADFVARAKDLYAAQRAQYDTQAALYRRLAEKQGADPDDIVGAGEVKTEPPAAQVTVREKKTGRTKKLDLKVAASLPPAEFEVLP